MRWKGVGQWLTIVVLLMGSACGSDSDPGSPTTGEEFVNAVARAYCDNIASCCSAEQQANFNYRECLNAQAFLYSFDARDAERYGIPYDQSAGEECVAATAAVTQQCGRHVSEDEKVDGEACQRVYRGSKGPGDPCRTPYECEPVPGADHLCEGASLDEAICILTYSNVQEGEPCTPERTLEGPFVWRECDGSQRLRCLGDPPVCTRGPDAGEPCDNEWCALEASCDFTTSICVERPQIGDDCLPSESVTASGRCAPGAECVSDECVEELVGPDVVINCEPDLSAFSTQLR
jgi:hypothetical protein